MKLLSIQVALFAAMSIERQDLLFAEINKKLEGVFDTIPIIAPLPIDAPPEVPVVIASSNNKKYSLNIARSRLDFVISLGVNEDLMPFQAFEQFKSTITKYYRTVIQTQKINRIGVVFTLFEENSCAVKSIVDKYFSTAYTVDTTEISLRYNKQSKLDNRVINNIVSVNSGQVSAQKTDGKSQLFDGILFQLDTNNVPVGDNVIESEVISKIIKISSDGLKPGKIKELI